VVILKIFYDHLRMKKIYLKGPLLPQWYNKRIVETTRSGS
jgi:hypothetical protein